MNEKKPEWVPDWAWTEYLNYVRKWSQWANLSGDPSTTGQMMLRIGKDVISDKNCASIWPAMERRSCIALERWHAQQANAPEGTRYGNPDQLHGLLTVIALSMRGPSPDEIVPARERRERGARIVRLVGDLRRELIALTAGQGSPMIFRNAYDEAADEVKALVRDGYERTADMFDGDLLADEDLNQIEYAARDGFLMGLDGDFQALRAIERGATAWMESEPVVYRPNGAGTERLYFIRRITAFFRTSYDTPLRDATAALTRCLFDCDIDGATVAKLAP